MTNSPIDLTRFEKEEYCYLTTRGRVTGKPHQIEIWFGMNGRSLYLLSGGMDKSDWVRNLLKDPNVTVQISKYNFLATARIVTDQAEETQARELLANKYKEREHDGSLSDWARTALVVGIDLTV